MMGSALAVPARDNGHEVRLAGTPLDGHIIRALLSGLGHPTLERDLPRGTGYYYAEAAAEALSGAELVICGVSSFGVDWFAESVLPLLPPDVPVLSVTKGLLCSPGGVLTTFPDYYASLAPQRPYCAIGGPCTSYELADKAPTHVCFCGEDPAVLQNLRAMLATPYYRASLSCDVFGVETAAALKNAYALAVTLTRSRNSQAALFGQAVAEMRGLLALFGAGAENIAYAAGDLYVTIFGGRTRLLGDLLGSGLPYSEAARRLEGVTLESAVIARRAAFALRKALEAGRASGGDYPLLLHMGEVIAENKPAPLLWESLF
jgi:glycerol-3-phosphate dehydrogenase (NAD(P)+)